MLNLVTDFDIHISHDGENMGTVPVSFDGTTYTLCDACYGLHSSIGSRRYTIRMNRIMEMINSGYMYAKIGKTVWRIVAV